MKQLAYDNKVKRTGTDTTSLRVTSPLYPKAAQTTRVLFTRVSTKKEKQAI